MPTKLLAARLRSRRLFAASLVLLATCPGPLPTRSSAQEIVQWSGSLSSQWSAAGNWSNNAEPTSSSILLFPSTGSTTLQLSSGETAFSLSFQGSYTLAGGDLTLSGSGIDVSSGAVATINSVLKASGGIVKDGAGTLVLSAANLNLPVAVAAGTLELNRGGFLPAVTGIQSVAAGATVRFTGSGGNQIDNGAVSTVTPNGGIHGLDGTVDFNGHSETIPYLVGSSSGLVTNSGTAPSTLTIANSQGPSAPTQLYAGAINDGVGTMSLVVSGADARVTLTGASNFTGQTQILDGATLSVASLNRVVGGSTTSSLGAPVSAATGTIVLGSNSLPAQLRYAGSGETTDRRIALGGTTGDGIVTADGIGALVVAGDITATQAGAKRLVLSGSNAGGNTFSGTLTDGSGTVGLVKQGAGNWTLTGSNSFTGDTVVNGGELRAAGTGALGSGSLGTSQVTVNNSGSLILSGSATDRVRDDAALSVSGGGALRLQSDLGTSSERLGALTLSAGSVIDYDPASGGFGFSLLLSSLTVPSTGSAVVQNWNSNLGIGSTDHLLMDSLPAGYSLGSSTSAILFDLNGSYYPATFVASGTGYEAVASLVPVPEPSTCFTAALVAGGLLWRERRRFLPLR